MGPVRRFSYEWEPGSGASVANLRFGSGAVGTLQLAAGIAGSSPLERVEVIVRDANVVVENGHHDGRPVLHRARPGEPRHFHPNCDEVLHVLQGTIEHSADDEVVAMGPGDTISIPSGVVHNARNVGADQAVFVIAFSTPDRQVVGE